MGRILFDSESRPEMQAYCGERYDENAGWDYFEYESDEQPVLSVLAEYDLGD